MSDPIPRKMTQPYVTLRPKEEWYQLPEICFLPGNGPVYQVCRRLCIRYTLPYPEARKKHFEMEAQKYPEVLE